VQVETSFAGGEPCVTGDAGRLQQVVLNLVINAIHAMEGRERRLVRVRTGHDAGAVSLCVEDTGPGIAPEVAQRIFERFFTTKPSGKGTGLGLWIVQQIVAEHGGSVEVTNCEGDGGARFTVRLPADARAGVTAGRAA
jgi:two-component system C4-dicarboxylate transport sensor histidine kinase DctB